MNTDPIIVEGQSRFATLASEMQKAFPDAGFYFEQPVKGQWGGMTEASIRIGAKDMSGAAVYARVRFRGRSTWHRNLSKEHTTISLDTNVSGMGTIRGTYKLFGGNNLAEKLGTRMKTVYEEATNKYRLNATTHKAQDDIKRRATALFPLLLTGYSLYEYPFHDVRTTSVDVTLVDKEHEQVSLRYHHDEGKESFALLKLPAVSREQFVRIMDIVREGRKDD